MHKHVIFGSVEIEVTSFHSHGSCPRSPIQTKLHCLKWRPYMARRLFSKPIHAKEERNGPPSANNRLSTAKPRRSMLFQPRK